MFNLICFYIILLVSQFSPFRDSNQSLTLPMHLQRISLEEKKTSEVFSSNLEVKVEKNITAVEKETRCSFCFTKCTLPFNFAERGVSAVAQWIKTPTAVARVAVEVQV